jgi:hypothetical protein
VHPDWLSWLSHGSKSFHVLQSLHYYCSFEKEEHEEVEQTVVPVLIKEPQQSAKELKHEKWSNYMLFVQI